MPKEEGEGECQEDRVKSPVMPVKICELGRIVAGLMVYSMGALEQRVKHVILLEEG